MTSFYLKVLFAIFSYLHFLSSSHETGRRMTSEGIATQISRPFPLVFPWVPLVSLVWRCTLPQNKSTPPTPSTKTETFLLIVPRGTPVQSRISRSLFLIALYICFMQCIDNKANKRTMIKGRASPVAITYRPNQNAMYPQNKVSTKYITNPIKYTISNHDFKITPK